MGQLWSVGIFAEDKDRAITAAPAHAVRVFDARRLRTKRDHVHTYADPFLYVHESVLYLFFEVQQINQHGCIHAWKTADLQSWTEIGLVLQEPHHCSYPYVFKDPRSGNIYMVPETSAVKAVSLYEFGDFPHKVSRKTDLLKGDFADTNILYHENHYYLSTFDQAKVQHRLYCSPDLTGPWTEHPSSPASVSKANARNGGGFFKIDTKLYRSAQNMTHKYGEGIVLFEVLCLSPTRYEEVIVVPDLKPAAPLSWQRKGRHHMSVADFNGKRVIALDGVQSDMAMNRLSNMIFKFI